MVTVTGVSEELSASIFTDKQSTKNSCAIKYENIVSVRMMGFASQWA
jgi:hypothetical protein